MTKNKEADRELNKEDYVSVFLHKEDLETLVNLLSTTAALYTKMASNATDEKDADNIRICSARAKLMIAYAERFLAVAAIGEPTSKEMH